MYMEALRYLPSLDNYVEAALISIGDEYTMELKSKRWNLDQRLKVSFSDIDEEPQDPKYTTTSKVCCKSPPRQDGKRDNTRKAKAKQGQKTQQVLKPWNF
jgi:hypothetical protein